MQAKCEKFDENACRKNCQWVCGTNEDCMERRLRNASHVAVPAGAEPASPPDVAELVAGYSLMRDTLNALADKSISIIQADEALAAPIPKLASAGSVTASRPPQEGAKAPRFSFSKDWCMRMAELEGDSAIEAGAASSLSNAQENLGIPEPYAADARVPDDFRNQAAGYRAGWNDCLLNIQAPSVAQEHAKEELLVQVAHEIWARQPESLEAAISIARRLSGASSIQSPAAAPGEMLDLIRDEWRLARLSDDDNQYELDTPYVVVDQLRNGKRVTCVLSGGALNEAIDRTWSFRIPYYRKPLLDSRAGQGQAKKVKPVASDNQKP